MKTLQVEVVRANAKEGLMQRRDGAEDLVSSRVSQSVSVQGNVCRHRRDINYLAKIEPIP